MIGDEFAAGDFEDTGGWACVVSGFSEGASVVDCTYLDSRGSL